ncbi:hypothetical protein LJC61_00030 [Ruminococcaceae bacterium OttesenSCG-928-A16]|nr:hypothetical protein [Ruminococcaceae bacterium OttesenSCG-928-A16]
MKRRLKSWLCLLVLVLLVGCTVGDAKSEALLPQVTMPATEATTSTADGAMPVAGGATERWREVCYAEVMSKINADNFGEVEEIAIQFYPDDKKVVNLEFTYSQTSPDADRKWAWLVSSDGEIIEQWFGKKYDYHELVPTENKAEGYFEATFLHNQAVLLTQQQTQQKIEDFLFDRYQPNLPAGAPEWVGAYMKLIYYNQTIPYRPGEQFSADEVSLRELTVLEPLAVGGAPVLYVAGLCHYNEELAYDGYYIFKNDMAQYVMGTYENGVYFYHDANNEPLLKRGYIWDTWYKNPYATFGTYGTEGRFLIVETHIMVVQQGEYEAGYTRYDGALSTEKAVTVLEYFASEEEAERWIEERLAEDLEEADIAMPLTPFKEVDYELPKTFTWQELETSLITFFMDYAKQMNG